MQIALIIPVYNSEQFLEKCIQSLENQTIFSKGVLQIIFVDDGSTDASVSMLNQFRDRFPKTVSVTVQKNKGPSAARNEGLRKISSEIDVVGFLDSDDSLEQTCIEKVARFFSTHPSIEVATIPRVFFGRIEGDHPLNERFNTENDSISIIDTPFNPQFFVGGTFIRKPLLQRLKLNFDESLHYFEDALFITRILLETGEYGLIKDTAYYYYKRESEDSLVDIHRLNGFPFLTLAIKGYNPLIQFSKKKYGQSIPYVHFLIMYHLRLSFRQRSQKMYEALSVDERNEFINLFNLLIEEISAETIAHLPLKKYEAEYLLYKISKKNKAYTPIVIQQVKRKGYQLEFTCSTLKEPKARIQVSKGMLLDEKIIEKRTFKLFDSYICNHRVEFKVSLKPWELMLGSIINYRAQNETLTRRKISFLTLLSEYLKRDKTASKNHPTRTYSINDITTLD